MDRLTSGQLAAAADVNPQTLRYYERRGLLGEPPRSESNYRLYDAAAVSRIVFIKRAQAMGFSLDEISGLLDLRADGSDCGEVRERVRAHLAVVETKLRDLQAIRETLRDLIDGCPGTGPLSECPILSCFEGDDGE